LLAQPRPLLFQKTVQLLIAELVQLAAGQHYNIHVWQIVLSQPETFADMALDAIALDGKSNVSLADHQTETRTLQGVGGSQEKDIAVRNLVSGVTEDPLKILAA
jgi:hypothetical protein